MSQEARRAKRAGKVVLQLYRERASYVADASAKMGVTCKEGCAHCCMIPATATIPEMVLVVEHLTSRCDWEKRRPALERELVKQLTEFVGVNVLNENERVAFFQRQIPCAFLTPEKRCSIYAVRPTVCRYHLVVSPPQHCEHGPEAKPLELLDLKKLEHEVSLAGARAFGELTGGPIALAFVLAAKALGVHLNIPADLLQRLTIVRMPVEVRA